MTFCGNEEIRDDGSKMANGNISRDLTPGHEICTHFYLLVFILVCILRACVECSRGLHHSWDASSVSFALHMLHYFKFIYLTISS